MYAGCRRSKCFLLQARCANLQSESTMNQSTSSFRRRLQVFVLLTIACAACCAIPLIGALGIASVATAAWTAFALHERMMMLVLGGIAATFAFILVMLRLRKSRRAACARACAIDQDC